LRPGRKFVAPEGQNSCRLHLFTTATSADADADASISRSLGIEVVHQDIALAHRQPVCMNLFLGREPVRGPLASSTGGA